MVTTLERIIAQLEARGYTVTKNPHSQGYRVTMASGYVLLPRAKVIELAAINLAHSKGYAMGMQSAITSMRASEP